MALGDIPVPTIEDVQKKVTEIHQAANYDLKENDVDMVHAIWYTF